MVKAVANTGYLNTFDFLIQRTNELATAMSNITVTTNSNTTTGNAVVNGTVQVVTLTANALSGSQTVYANGIVGPAGNLYVSSVMVSQNTAWFQGGLILGNATVNSVMTNSSITTTTINAVSANFSGNSAANNYNATTSVIVGNSSLTATSLSVGNSTVNGSITQTSIFSGNSTNYFQSNTTAAAIVTASGNSVLSATQLKVSNSTSNTTLAVPTSAQWTAGNYYLNANGSWIQVTAGSVGFTPAGNIANTTVQGAIQELDNEKVPLTSQVLGSGYITGGGVLSSNAVLSLGNMGAVSRILGSTSNTAAITDIVMGNGLNITNNVIDVNLATNSDYVVGSSTTKFLTPGVVWSSVGMNFPTFGATLTLDGSTAINFQFTATSNFTLANPVNFKAGQSGMLVIVQDATGGRTISYGTAWKFPSGSNKTLTTSANFIDVLFYTVVNSTFIVCSLQKAYQ